MTDRRQFVVYLIAMFAVAAAPSLERTRRREIMFLRADAASVGDEVIGYAEDGVVFVLRCAVTATRQISDGCWLWAVEHDDVGFDVFYLDRRTGRRIAVVEEDIPDDLVEQIRDRHRRGAAPWWLR